MMIANVGGHCFMGKIPMDLLQLSWGKSMNLDSGERAEMLLPVDLHSCFLKVCNSDNSFGCIMCHWKIMKLNMVIYTSRCF